MTITADVLMADRSVVRLLVNVAGRIAGSENADDVIQTLALKLHKRPAQFNESYPLTSFLVAITKRQAIDYRRAQLAKLGRVTVQLDQHDHADTSTDVRSRHERAEILLTRLETFKAGCKPKQIQILERLADGSKYSDIAKELDCPVATVKTLIRRMRIALTA